MKADISSTKFELDGATLLIAGLGGIGAGLAQKAKGLGMHVLGVRKRDVPPPPGVDEILTQDRLHEGLGRADHVALCLPLTDETTGYLGEAELRAMKPSAYVYNVGRGKSIDREALLQALREGWIAGAGLDVTDPEPLPSDDPLWSFPNVLLSQHTSGSSHQLDRRVTDIFAANLRRFLNNEPLENLVDYTLGY
jgi:phosphoglycerate dehydrogenase-like enzyme